MLFSVKSAKSIWQKDTKSCCNLQRKILEETKPIKIIWICWLQGIENAPELVQSCFQSVEKYKNDYKIQLITEKNLSDFVALPDYILKKWKSGIISNTHFSDIVRACLLADYGGVWVDSTVLFLSNIPENIANLPLFMFRNEHKLDKSIVSSSWLISCFKNHPMLVEMKEFLFAYWKREHKLKNYFLFHIYFTLLSKKYCEFWNDVPFISNINPHTLYFYDLFRTV
jgi:mannosyltransferase OCH1-like enzyme